VERTDIVIVGCGFVADSYRQCLDLHPELRLVGVYDRDAGRLAAFRATWGDEGFGSMAATLSAAPVVVNLTSVESHFEVTQAALATGRHVYSEKPLATSAHGARALQAQASGAGLRLAGAPCNLLGEAAQTAWAAVRAGRIGRPRLVYAELDDGLVHKAPYRNWISRSGRRWPARDEFEIGCTFEHAGYALGPLAAMFGPARRVTAVSGLMIADKGVEPPLPHPAPDFSVGLIEYDGGVIARVTNSIVAPYDHRFRIVGEEGALEIGELWDYASPVKLRRPAASRLARFAERRFGGLPPQRLKPARPCPLPRGRGKPTMDFMRGVAELAEALQENRRCRLDADLAVHIAEVTERLQHPERFEDRAVLSAFDPIPPMPWA
jgi:predicted dehydrogenase